MKNTISDKNCWQDFTGRETGRTIQNGISVYYGEYGSVRFLLRHSGEIIAGLQIVVNSEIAIASNIYTKPEHERRGYATKLYEKAVSLYPNLMLSDDKTEQGKSWAAKLATTHVVVERNRPAPKLIRTF